MATPQPQTSPAFPRRAETQPSRPLGQAAGGEKEITELLGSQRPDITGKVPSVTRPALSRIVDPEAEAELPPLEKSVKAAKPAKESAPAPAADWGLGAKESASSWKPKALIGAVVLAIAAGGGYFGYTKYYGSGPDEVEPTVAADGAAGGDDIPEADPFSSDETAPRTAKSKPSAPRVTEHPEAFEMIDDVVEDTRPNVKSRALAKAQDTSRAKSASRESEPALEMPIDLDDPEMVQQEPEEPDELEVDEPPVLHIPKKAASAPPRLVAIPTPSRAEPTVDPLDGYEVVNERSAPRLRPAEAQSPADEAEQMEGFEATELDEGRAAFKTTVTRPVAGEVPPPASATLGASLADDDVQFENEAPSAAPAVPGRANAQTKVMPRRSPPVEAATDSSFSPNSRPAPKAPAGEIYTVAPNDNFWTISRKQYGTGRYFAALTKHNQDRVPEPQRMRPGLQVSTPPAKLLEERYPELIDKSAPAPAAAVAPSAPKGTRVERVDNRPWFGPPDAARMADKPAGESKIEQSGYFYSKSGEPMYRIGSDDTLTGIAQKHLGRSSRWTEIYDQNQDVLKAPDRLTLGTVIRLPPDASRLGLAPDANRRR